MIANGFRRSRSRFWIVEGPISTVVRLWTRRGLDAPLFTLEWGFFSPEFASAMHFPTDPDTLTAALRAPIGRLLGDGRFDVWWAIYPDGAVQREAGAESVPVEPETDVELMTALTERIVPFARTITTVDALSARFTELAGMMQTGLADASRTLALIQGKNDENAVPGTAVSPNTDMDALPPVFVEPAEGTHMLMVSFDDEIAHLHEDLVQRALTYCRGFPGVHEAVWSDREIISLSGKDIAIEPLQADLLRMVQDALEVRTAEDADDDGDS